MAQVTMTSEEYLELIAKVRRLDKLEQDIVDGITVELRPDGTYSKCNIHVQPVMTQETEQRVVRKIVDAIKDVDYVMDDLVREDAHFFNPTNGYISSHWSNTPEPGEIDLLKDKVFKATWDATKAKLVSETEEEE